MKRISVIVGLIVAVSVVVAPAAYAASPTREAVENTGFGDLPAGAVCEFPISFNPVEPYPNTVTTYATKTGETIRVATIAKVSQWTITNLDTDASATVRLPAGREVDTTQADGSLDFVLTGGWFIGNDASGNPPGPFLVIGSGRAAAHVSVDGVLTLASVAGRNVELCAAVAS